MSPAKGWMRPASSAARLQQPHAGGADRHDAPSGRARGVDRGGGGRRDLAMFGVDAVARDVVASHRQERAGADMQRQRDAPDAARFQRRQQGRGEMQAGGGRRDRALVRGEHVW